MEKLKPTYDLDSIKAEFTSVEKLRITRTATDTAFALGYWLQDVVDVIQGMSRSHFVKSMTSLADHRVWQDVYNVRHRGRRLYVKFTVDADGDLLISFKEKES